MTWTLPTVRAVGTDRQWNMNRRPITTPDVLRFVYLVYKKFNVDDAEVLVSESTFYDISLDELTRKYLTLAIDGTYSMKYLGKTVTIKVDQGVAANEAFAGLVSDPDNKSFYVITVGTVAPALPV